MVVRFRSAAALRHCGILLSLFFWLNGCFCGVVCDVAADCPSHPAEAAFVTPLSNCSAGDHLLLISEMMCIILDDGAVVVGMCCCCCCCFATARHGTARHDHLVRHDHLARHDDLVLGLWREANIKSLHGTAEHDTRDSRR
jgi:hypothetical protein